MFLLLAIHSAKALGQPPVGHSSIVGNSFTPGSDEARDSVWIRHLTLVTKQGFDLAIKLIGDIDEMLGVGATHDPCLGHRMRLQTFLGKKWDVCEFVSRVGVDGAHRCLARSEMIRVAAVGPVEGANRTLRHDSVGLNDANDSADRFAKLKVGLDRTIGKAEEMQLVDSENLGGFCLFDSANLGHTIAADGVIGAARLPVGNEAVDDPMAGVGHVGGRASAPKVEIVGMGCDVENGERGSHPSHSMQLGEASTQPGRSIRRSTRLAVAFMIAFAYVVHSAMELPVTSHRWCSGS